MSTTADERRKSMTVDPQAEQAQQLFEGLAKERAIYESLRELSVRQEGILAGGNTEEILELVQAKGRQLDEIERIERRIAPLKEQWPCIKDGLAEDLRSAVDAELENIQAVLRQLIDLENTGQQGLDQARRETADELKRVDDVRRMQNAYRAVQPRSITGGAGGASTRSVDRVE